MQKRLKADGYWVRVGLPALTILFGMQVVRALLPLLLYVLRERIGWSAIQVGELAFAIFLAGFLAAGLRRLLGPRRMLVITAAGLGLFRLGMQLWTADPLVELYLAAAAAILFALFLPIYLGHVRPGGVAATGQLALGLLLGLALDTALHGAYATYDMSWRGDVGTAVLLLLLVLVQWLLLARAVAAGNTAPPASDVPFGLALTWLALGPYLFLQLLILQNVARLTALTSWAQPVAFGWATLSHALGVGMAVWSLRRQRGSWLGTAVMGLIFFAIFLVPWPDGLLAAVLFLAGQILAAWLLALILAGLGAGDGRAGLSRITISHGLGLFLMTLFSFLYYMVYQISLPFSNALLPPLAALVVGLAALGATRALATSATGESAVTANWRPVLITLLLLLAPFFKLVTWSKPETATRSGFPVRVMTYNLHNGFDTNGYLGMEAIAQVIAKQQPDVVALQEISRGWVVNGSLDMLAWLSQRLEMPYVYGPTADPLWGNAILSRFPITEYELVELPPDDLLLRRGFIWAKVDVGAGQHLNLIATHYHHPGDGGPVRVTQSQTILDYWQGDETTLLMGDLNARPGDTEIEMIRQAGLAEALDLGGVAPGYTYPADGPSVRIDYVWVTADLTASDVIIPPDAASDHLGIAATVEK